MSTLPDPIALRPLQVPVRPAYGLGVLLDSEDFDAEQGYHRARQARALKYLFGTGTLAGLQVIWRAATAELTVTPGLALDPLGRLLELPRPVSIRLRGGPADDDSWFDVQLPQDLRDGVLGGALLADVFVRSNVCASALTAARTLGPFDALDAAMPTRRNDGCEVALVIRTDAAAGVEPALPDDVDILETRPVNPAAAQRWAKERILAAWRDRSQDWTGSDTDPERARPLPLVEHLTRARPDSSLDPDFVDFPHVLRVGTRQVTLRHDPLQVGRDTRSVLLARVRVPVTGVPPTDAGQPPAIDNGVRRFIRSSGAYTQPVNGGP